MELIKIENCIITEKSLEINKNTTKEQWQNIGYKLKTMQKCIGWWIGDWERFGEKKGYYTDSKVYDEIQEITGLDRGTLKNMKYVAEKIPSSCRHDELSFTHHQEVVSLEPEQQKQVLQKAVDEKLTVRETREEVKKLKHADKKKQDLPSNKYQIIYADPPWKYDNDVAYFGQSVERHYPVMTKDELCALPIKGLADENCVLYLWVPAPKLNWVPDILKAWGFEYKTCLVWDKVKHNMGYYASIRHEILLIGGRGSSKPDDASAANKTDSVYMEERTEHSKKPEYYYSMIESHHPLKKKRIELFARKKRAGWDSWGNEI